MRLAVAALLILARRFGVWLWVVGDGLLLVLGLGV